MISALILPILHQDRLVIDPLLLVQAAEVWSVIGRKDNPVWPGWDARKTPILIYFPGKQDVLINHPNPPAGFIPYTGPLKSPIGKIYLKDGKTIKEFDGQNTSTDVAGVETLVVADTLSTLRQNMSSFVGREDGVKAIEESLFHNPFDSMALFAHEAFHVYQFTLARKKGANEMDVLKYPSLGVENNTGFALEADQLLAAAKARNPQEVRGAAVKWLAARQWRRESLKASDKAYEDGNEFTEGLAKYVEYRLTEALQGRTPGKEMWLIQGFEGYGDLQSQRNRMLDKMRSAMSGELNVNNDKYGASPIRFRLYFSGMGIGALLDRLGARWHDLVLKTPVTLTELVESTVRPTTTELSQARASLLSSARYKELLQAKTKLKEDGEAHIREVLAGFDKSPGELVIDYSKLAKPQVGFGFTPFGVLRVSEDSAVLRLLPIRGFVGKLGVGEDSARPVFHDQKSKIIRYQLTGLPDEKTRTLPGVTLENVKGSFSFQGRKVVLMLED